MILGKNIFNLEFWEAINALIAAVISLAAFAISLLTVQIRKWLKEWQSRKSITPSVEQSLWINTKIHELLSDLRAEFDAQRAFLSRYHNGDYFIDNVDVLKKTRTHEVVREGIAYQADSFKGMPISQVSDELKYVVENGAGFFRVDELPHRKFRWLCEMAGMWAGARCAIHDSEGKKIIGFVGLDFDRTADPPPNLDKICEYAWRIGQVVVYEEAREG